MSEGRPAALPVAVSLRWDGKGAPRVTAKGKGEIAERIIELAKANGVPLREDRALVEVLSRIDLTHQIPPQLYVAVAEVIAFAYAISGKTNEPSQASPPPEP